MCHSQYAGPERCKRPMHLRDITDMSRQQLCGSVLLQMVSSYFFVLIHGRLHSQSHAEASSLLLLIQHNNVSILQHSEPNQSRGSFMPMLNAAYDSLMLLGPCQALITMMFGADS